MPDRDAPVVMTLDAGGTNFVFCALRSGRPQTQSFSVPAHADRLEQSLDTLIAGFKQVKERLTAPPAAISFAFPGPADYARGIIRNPPNLPAWRDVALGPILEDTFGLPTFINNDGDLFAYGEARAGLLPYVNGLLEKAASPKRFRNLLGVTIGTGFGGGVVIDGNLLAGDNSSAGEVWLLRHKLRRDWNAEEGVSVRAIRRTYAAQSGIGPDEAPDPEAICAIAEGRLPGNRAAALESFRQLGESAGDAIAQIVTVLDGLVVVGGGITGAHRHFLPALVAEMNGEYRGATGHCFRRLIQQAFNLEEPGQIELFLRGSVRELGIPASGRPVRFDALPRVGVGLSRLGTSEAIAIGAYEFALSRLEKGHAR